MEVSSLQAINYSLIEKHQGVVRFIAWTHRAFTNISLHKLSIVRIYREHDRELLRTLCTSSWC